MTDLYLETFIVNIKRKTHLINSFSWFFFHATSYTHIKNDEIFTSKEKNFQIFFSAQYLSGIQKKNEMLNDIK